jgi:pimeloyl-ACP methyl ester carboxylesterase
MPVPSPPPAPLQETRLEVEDVGLVCGWFSDGTQSGPALIFLHGNAENLETMRRSGTLQALDDLGPWLAIDYPGYGRSEGKATEKRLVASTAAAVKWMRQRYPDRPLVLLGWSLGAAVALQTAVGSRVDGIVALSPWASLEEIGREHFPSWMVRLFARESYDSLDAAGKIEVPALVIHGARDSIIPVDHGRRVAAALPDSRWVQVEGYGHNDLLGAPLVWAEMRSFMEAR